MLVLFDNSVDLNFLVCVVGVYGEGEVKIGFFIFVFF